MNSLNKTALQCVPLIQDRLADGPADAVSAYQSMTHLGNTPSILVLYLIRAKKYLRAISFVYNDSTLAKATIARQS